MNTWLHRISHHAEASYPLLERGYLTIGYSNFSSPEFIVGVSDSSESDGWKHFETAFDEHWGKRPKGRHALRKFLVEMKAGDRVLVPKFGGVFSIYEIIGDPLCIREVDTISLHAWGSAEGDELSVNANGLLTRASKALDLGFARRVRLIKENIKRAFADAALTSRMKTRWTTSNISALATSVDASIEAKAPINLRAALLEKLTETTLEVIRKELNPDRFEKLVMWYLKRAGAHVDRPPKNESGKQGDGDIVATFEALRTIIYVQAKHHEGITGAAAAEQIIAYLDHKETLATEGDVVVDYSRIAWVVSTSDDFSPACYARAAEKKVLLLNGEEFVELLLNVGIESLDTAV